MRDLRRISEELYIIFRDNKPWEATQLVAERLSILLSDTPPAAPHQSGEEMNGVR